MGNLDAVIRPLPSAQFYLSTDYHYDNLNRLTFQADYGDATGEGVFNIGFSWFAYYEYTVQADGKRTQVWENDGAGNTTIYDWVYDELGRLVEEKRTCPFRQDHVFSFGLNRQAAAISTREVSDGEQGARRGEGSMVA